MSDWIVIDRTLAFPMGGLSFEVVKNFHYVVESKQTGERKRVYMRDDEERNPGDVVSDSEFEEADAHDS